MVDSIEHLQKIIIFIQALPQRIFLFNWDELPIQNSLDYSFEWSAELGKRHPNMTFISCLQAHYLYTFVFRAPTCPNLQKKQLRDTKFDMIEFSSKSYKGRIFPNPKHVGIQFPSSQPSYPFVDQRSSALELCPFCLGSLPPSTRQCQCDHSQRSGCDINTESVEIDLGIVN